MILWVIQIWLQRYRFCHDYPNKTLIFLTTHPKTLLGTIFLSIGQTMRKWAALRYILYPHFIPIPLFNDKEQLSNVNEQLFNDSEQLFNDNEQLFLTAQLLSISGHIVFQFQGTSSLSRRVHSLPVAPHMMNESHRISFSCRRHNYSMNELCDRKMVCDATR